MKKYLFLLVLPLIVFAIAGFFVYSNVSAQTEVCPVGFTCTPIENLCPEGFVCTPVNQTDNCPEGFVCRLIDKTTTNTCYQFLTNLTVGASGRDVIALQKELSVQGFYTGLVTGYFGYTTKTAVMRFQTANGLPSTGYVGSLTRATLNSCGNDKGVTTATFKMTSPVSGGKYYTNNPVNIEWTGYNISLANKKILVGSSNVEDGKGLLFDLEADSIPCKGDSMSFSCQLIWYPEKVSANTGIQVYLTDGSGTVIYHQDSVSNLVIASTSAVLNPQVILQPNYIQSNTYVNVTPRFPGTGATLNMVCPAGVEVFVKGAQDLCKSSISVMNGVTYTIVPTNKTNSVESVAVDVVYYTHNIRNQMSAKLVVYPEPAITVSPKAIFTVGGQSSYTYNVGDTNEYRWSSEGGDKFYSTYTANYPERCGYGDWVANTASGVSRTYLIPEWAGCEWKVTYTVTNTKTGQSDSETVVHKVRELSTPIVTPVIQPVKEPQISVKTSATSVLANGRMSITVDPGSDTTTTNNLYLSCPSGVQVFTDMGENLCSTRFPISAGTVNLITVNPKNSTNMPVSVSVLAEQALGTRKATANTSFTIGAGVQVVQNPVGSDPIASLTVNNQVYSTSNVGEYMNFKWSGKNADTFLVRSTPAMTQDFSKCGTTPWTTNTASGEQAVYVRPEYSGCQWEIRYSAKNSQTGRIHTDSVTVKVNVAPSTSVNTTSSVFNAFDKLFQW